jgi:hypothetical protein
MSTNHEQCDCCHSVVAVDDDLGWLVRCKRKQYAMVMGAISLLHKPSSGRLSTISLTSSNTRLGKGELYPGSAACVQYIDMRHLLELQVMEIRITLLPRCGIW